MEELGEQRSSRIAYDRIAYDNVEVDRSLNFPNLPLRTTIPTYVERSRIEGRNAVMRAFRAWVRQELRQSGLGGVDITQ